MFYLFLVVPPPKMVIAPQNITAAVYRSITFSFTGRGFGNVKVVWTKPPSKVTLTAVYASERNDNHITSTLTISHLVDIYSGMYCCAVKNHVGSSELGCAYLHIEGSYYLQLCCISVYQISMCILCIYIGNLTLYVLYTLSWISKKTDLKY